ncbi:PREDICTED: F-box/LRR-repeat protein 2-like [Priapulus caudatus]|uniref:F-box/LRR-repeat protein 2-like n=1 Tax=Priapulus caudatus TaxID=37621 RepID=A0ABM1EI69_PRICU|nr:PREDICTED: F-box/LRR-repeat protein 2-like [Priapulus caudatus]XP_014671895.1 PREDICTED: F-box/LRR-repeat protein 2-like [Priapulus caudatus]
MLISKHLERFKRPKSFTAESSEEPDFFARIPDEVIVRIFAALLPAVGHLPKLSRVCRRWYILSQDPVLWTHLDFQCANRSSRLQKAVFKDFVQKWHRVTCHVDLSGVGMYVTDGYLKYVGKYCQKLVVLNLSGCSRVTDKGLVHLSSGCKKLKSLTLQSCPEVTCQGVTQVAKQCVNLECLVMTDCEGLWRDPHHMRAMSTYCTRLKSFSVACTTAVRGIMIDRDIRFFALFCTQLKQLNVASSQITDAAMKYIAKYCVQLVDLGVAYCCVTDKGFRHAFPKLQRLDLKGCWNVTDVGVKSIAQHSREMRRLDLSWCFRVTDVALVHLARRCRRLETLTLEHCLAVSVTGIVRLSESCPNLQTLNVGSMNLHASVGRLRPSLTRRYDGRQSAPPAERRQDGRRQGAPPAESRRPRSAVIRESMLESANSLPSILEYQNAGRETLDGRARLSSSSTSQLGRQTALHRLHQSFDSIIETVNGVKRVGGTAPPIDECCKLQSGVRVCKTL